MKGLSKSCYTAFCQCPKALWLKVFKPKEAVVDEALQARFEQGTKVGELAQKLFGESKDVTTKNAEGNLDLTRMAALTKQYMDEGVENICEASFIGQSSIFNSQSSISNYCAVDILHRNGDGWDIYEVKSSTYKGDEHDTAKDLLAYTRDIAYQKWLLTQCGVKVNGCYLVRLNKFYVRGKELDIQGLFHVKDMEELVENEYMKVEANVGLAQKVLQGDEPFELVAIHCHQPYNCAFFKYCVGDIEEPNVFDLYRMNFKRKCELYNEGKISFQDLVGEKLSEVQQ